jgi:SAM-dependent methyltransferase
MRPFVTMPKFVIDYGNLGTPAQPDGRLEGPAFRRNHEAIWQAISQYLNTTTGDVLEVGSGTGQHATEFARRAPHLIWWPSDIFDSHLASIAAWRKLAQLDNLRAPQRIDVTDPDWTWQHDGDGELAAILCINVLHISPWKVSQNLVAGAGRLLREGGHLFIYGPFKRDGAHTAPSNAAFDASLRTENPDWGVRDVHDLDALAQAAGLSPAEITTMPANNLVLAFTRGVRQN